MGFFSDIKNFVSSFFDLFGGQDVISVYSTVTPILQTNDREIQDGVLYGVISGSNSISNTLMELANSSTSARINQVKKYAESYYTLGLPKGTAGVGEVIDENVVAAAIQDDLELENEVLIDITFLSELNRAHVAYPFLIDQRNLDTETLIITSYPAGIPLPSTYLGYPVTNTVYVNSINISSLLTTITIQYKIRSYYVPSGTPVYLPDTFYSENYNVPSELNIGNYYCIAVYQETDGIGTPIGDYKWWFYDTSSLKYPNIALEYALQNQDTYLPIVPMRYQNLDMTREAVQDTNLYKTSKILFDKAGLDINDIADIINSNPQVNEIDYAYFMWGISLQTTHEVSIKYLTEFFDHLSDLSDISLIEVNAAILAGEPIPQNNYGFNKPPPISDPTVYGLNSSITYSDITSQIIAGSIGPKGTATMNKVYQAPIEQELGPVIDNSYLVLRHQITDNAYKQVKVTGLKHTNIIENKTITTTLTDIINDSENNNLVLPVNYGIAFRLNLFDRNRLYEAAACLRINAYVVTHLDWYETSFFAFLVTVVIVIIAIWSGQGWLTGLTAAAGLGAAAVVLYILATLINVAVYTLLFRWVAKEIGPDNALIAAVVTIVVAWVWGGFSEPNSVGALTSEIMLQSSIALMSGAQFEYNRQAEELAKANDALESEYETKWTELEELLDELFPEGDLSFDLISSQSVHKKYDSNTLESPEQFYNRTIHVGNPGILCKDALNNYFDLALSLPKSTV